MEYGLLQHFTGAITQSLKNTKQCEFLVDLRSENNFVEHCKSIRDDLYLIFSISDHADKCFGFPRDSWLFLLKSMKLNFHIL